MPTFEPPTVNDVPPILPSTRGVQRALYRHMRPRARGRSVVKEAGVYTTTDLPTQERCNAAQVVYLGGHIYVISDTEAAALIAAGYTVIPDPPPPAVYPATDIYPALDLYPGG